jgi:exodeoxyribonuclease VII large subunit
MAAGLERAGSRLRHAADRLSREHPGHLAQRCRQRLDACDWRRPVLASLATRQRDLNALERHARSLSPQHVVERGFAVVRRADGTVVRGPDQVAAGEIVAVTVARGVLAARIEGK